MKKITIGWAPITLWLLGSLAILSGIFRTLVTGEALATGVMPEDPADLHYVNHAALTLLHVIPGTLFLLLGPLQFIADIRNRWPWLHRLSGVVFILSGLTFAITALIIDLTFPTFGGPFKRLAVWVFSIAQIATLLVAVMAIRKRQIMRHRAWMMRAFAVGLGISPLRFYFIPAYLLFGVPSNFTIALGMWVGFGLNLLIAEWILWRERKPAAPLPIPG
ncbi:MAG TPA: DUF2306 domain-containing protein [Marinobacter sp.]|nr:DUF2306 domain-containing protein [Marinobacter sp.]